MGQPVHVLVLQMREATYITNADYLFSHWPRNTVLTRLTTEFGHATVCGADYRPVSWDPTVPEYFQARGSSLKLPGRVSSAVVNAVVQRWWSVRQSDRVEALPMLRRTLLVS